MCLICLGTDIYEEVENAHVRRVEEADALNGAFRASEVPACFRRFALVPTTNRVPRRCTTPSILQVGAFLSSPSRCVVVGFPSNPDPPFVVISAPDLVGTCDDLTLDGSATSASPGIVEISQGSCASFNLPTSPEPPMS